MASDELGRESMVLKASPEVTREYEPAPFSNPRDLPSSTSADGRAGAFLARLAGFHGEFFFDGRKSLEDFVKTQGHVADGVGLSLDGGGESGLEDQKLCVAEYCG